MAEEMMNEEMTGMAAPAPAEAPMPEESMPMEEPVSPKYDMETMMGNFLDMDQQKRKLATRLLASPAVELFDEIIGEPAMASLREQLGNEIQVGGEEPAPAPEGMMAPTAEPMAEAPEESPVAMSDGGVLGRKYGETSPENKKLIKLYKEDKLSLQGMQEFARDIDSRRLSEDESDTPSKEEMDAFYDMAYEYGEEELLPEKYSDK